MGASRLIWFCPSFPKRDFLVRFRVSNGISLHLRKSFVIARKCIFRAKTLLDYIIVRIPVGTPIYKSPLLEGVAGFVFDGDPQVTMSVTISASKFGRVLGWRR